jgi:hypothetical protein
VTRSGTDRHPAHAFVIRYSRKKMENGELEMKNIAGLLLTKGNNK